MKKTYWKIVGLILVAESLLLSFGVLNNFKNVFGPKQQATGNKIKIENAKVDPELINQAQEEVPIRIIIPKIFDLPIEKGEIDDGFWTIPEKLPAFLVGSTPPGKIGNTVIYGHAKEEVFGPLKDVQENDFIYLLTESKWLRYKVQKIKEIRPDEVEIIYPTLKVTLTLYTCTAFLDSKRLVIQAQEETSNKVIL